MIFLNKIPRKIFEYSVVFCCTLLCRWYFLNQNSSKDLWVLWCILLYFVVSVVFSEQQFLERSLSTLLYSVVLCCVGGFFWTNIPRKIFEYSVIFCFTVVFHFRPPNLGSKGKVLNRWHTVGFYFSRALGFEWVLDKDQFPREPRTQVFHPFHFLLRRMGAHPGTQGFHSLNLQSFLLKTCVLWTSASWCSFRKTEGPANLGSLVSFFLKIPQASGI